MPLTKLLSALSSIVGKLRRSPTEADLKHNIDRWEKRAEMARLAALDHPERQSNFEDLRQKALQRKEHFEIALAKLEKD